MDLHTLNELALAINKYLNNNLQPEDEKAVNRLMDILTIQRMLKEKPGLQMEVLEDAIKQTQEFMKNY